MRKTEDPDDIVLDLWKEDGIYIVACGSDISIITSDLFKAEEALKKEKNRTIDMDWEILTIEEFGSRLYEKGVNDFRIKIRKILKCI